MFTNKKSAECRLFVVEWSTLVFVLMICATNANQFKERAADISHLMWRARFPGAKTANPQWSNLFQQRNRHINAIPFTHPPLSESDYQNPENYSWFSDNSGHIHAKPSIRRPGEITDIRHTIRNSYSVPGVGFNTTLQIPIFQFDVLENQSPNDSQIITLPNNIFGVPIRKDLLHLAYWFHRRAMAGYTMRMQLTAGEWPGTKRKIRSQKKSGKARMDWRKSPGKYQGVQVHPLRPHNQRKRINRKTLYTAMKVLLSSKFMDGSLMVVNDFNVHSHKTAYTVRALRRLVGYRSNSVLLVHEGNGDVNDNFRFSTAHVTAVRRENVRSLSVYMLLRYRRVIFTEKGLRGLIEMLDGYGEENEWFARFATPDGKRAPVPEKVRNWNVEYLERRRVESENKFSRLDLYNRMRQWKWTNRTKGAFKVPRHDPFKGFRLLDARLKPYSPAWLKTDQITYHEEEPMDVEEADQESVEEMREQLMERERLFGQDFDVLEEKGGR